MLGQWVSLNLLVLETLTTPRGNKSQCRCPQPTMGETRWGKIRIVRSRFHRRQPVSFTPLPQPHAKTDPLPTVVEHLVTEQKRARILEPAMGREPMTCRLRIDCSTN